MGFQKGNKIGNTFKKGEDNRRNTTGANKGSKWASTLLKDLLTIDLSDSEIEQFKELKKKFPSVFNSNEQDNFQKFMELKQISLVFHKNGAISQSAINAIKDRIDGKPQQYIDHTSGDEQINFPILNINPLNDKIDNS